MKSYLSSSFNLKELILVFDELPLWAAPFGLKLLERITYKKNISALDIGFGAGFPLTELAMRLGNSCKVTGLDPWTDAAERAKQKISYYGINNVTLINGVAENIPLENESIDLLVSNNGLNNVQDTGKVFAECGRVCKPGAQMVFTMNINKSMFEFYAVLEQVLTSRRMQAEVDAMHAHIYAKRRPVDEIKHLVTGNGFKILDVHHDKFHYRFADATAMFNHYFIRLAFMGAWKALIPADMLEDIFDEVETVMNKLSAIKGGCTLSIPFITVDAVKV